MKKAASNVVDKLSTSWPIVKHKFFNTPLHLAAENGNTECVQELLRCDNIRLEAKNNKKRTPLHCAAVNGHYT